MHGVDENQPLFDAAFAQGFLHLRGDVHKPASGGDVEPEFFAIGFYTLPSSKFCVTLVTVLDSIRLR
jgi:hypothetical protein